MNFIFKIVRAVLAPIILMFERLSAPRLPQRTTERQRKLDVATARMKIYEFKACPFCVKVRQHLRRRGLNIERRDVMQNAAWEQELVTQGGELQVPCLRIEGDDGKIQWLYESSEIIAYLDKRFAADY
jgi:glutaredoxin